MIEKTRAIVLNHIKYSDSASIAHVYTEHSGRISVMIRHSKSRKSVSKKSFLQPLFLLEMQIDWKQNREIQFASEISNFPVFQSIPFNISKSTISMFLAEILTKVLKEEEPNPEMFNYLFNSIHLLDQIEQGIASFHIVFLYELSRYLGFYPINNYSEQNRFFNLREGSFSDHFDLPEITLDEQLSKDLFLIQLKSFKSLIEIKLSRTQRSRLLEAVLKFFHYHLPEMGFIKSLKILNEIFNA
jgi:DNA repair protein RecO (recombination protein O)